MKTLIELRCYCEDVKIESFVLFCQRNMQNFNTTYIKKGEEKKQNNGKKIIVKNTQLKISVIADDYNNYIIELLRIREKLESILTDVEHESYINLSFFSIDMLSLEIDTATMRLLTEQNLTLPISIYQGNMDND